MMKTVLIRDVWESGRPLNWLGRVYKFLRLRLNVVDPERDKENIWTQNHQLYMKLSDADKDQANALFEGKLNYVRFASDSATEDSA